MKVLITGGTGFLGSHLIPSLVRMGHEVVMLKRSFSDTSRLKDYFDQIQSWNIDSEPLVGVFEECGPFDCVIHTAANYGRHGESVLDVFESNLSFPLALLELSIRFDTTLFINTSTILDPFINFYALSKKQFEEWGKVFAENGGKCFVNVKLEHMYGPKDDISKFTTWIVRSCKDNVERLDLTQGEQRRDFVYIDDVVDAYMFLLTHVSELKGTYLEFHLGSGKSYSIREFVESVKTLTNSQTALFFGAKSYRSNEVMFSEADISELQKLGWEPKFDLIAGLKHMIERDH